MRLIVGISGASGVILGYEMLKALKLLPDCEVHLVVTEGAVKNFECETDLTVQDVCTLADVVHSNKNMAASISSGSFKTDGMIVIPCSMKTVAGIAAGYTDNLLLRSADVCLKEGRKVVIVPREMPLSRLHLRNIKEAADYGCVVVPPMLTFYNGSNSVEKQMQHIIGKVLMQFGIDYKHFVAWIGVVLYAGNVFLLWSGYDHFSAQHHHDRQTFRRLLHPTNIRPTDSSNGFKLPYNIRPECPKLGSL